MDNGINLELGELLEQRIQENFGSGDQGAYDVSDDRLKEMNKKAPQLEPGASFSFLK